MLGELLGIHHVTAIAGDPQRNMDFYTQVLGLRLVKLTVNFDDPETYHFYFGDAKGSPGTILTFFPWPGVATGREGAGQATAVAFSTPESSLGYWLDRLKAHGVAFDKPVKRFQEEVLEFRDPDGLRLELVERGGPGGERGWEGSPVPEAYAIQGLAGVTLKEADLDRTTEFLSGTLGFRTAAQDRVRFRFVAGAGGQWVDVLPAADAGRGRISVGSVHHVAWRAAGDAEQLDWRARLSGARLYVTAVMDRKYFRSIYFREPGGALFEIATDGPGFAVDEPREELDSRLMLPPGLEPVRAKLESALPPLRLTELVGG